MSFLRPLWSFCQHQWILPSQIIVIDGIFHLLLTVDGGSLSLMVKGYPTGCHYSGFSLPTVKSGHPSQWQCPLTCAWHKKQCNHGVLPSWTPKSEGHCKESVSETSRQGGEGEPFSSYLRNSGQYPAPRVGSFMLCLATFWQLILAAYTLSPSTASLISPR
jgi:hypothetical protein